MRAPVPGWGRSGARGTAVAPWRHCRGAAGAFMVRAYCDSARFEREPFVGLQAYTPHKVHLFFGREQETDELIALLRKTPFVLVTGENQLQR